MMEHLSVLLFLLVVPQTLLYFHSSLDQGRNILNHLYENKTMNNSDINEGKILKRDVRQVFADEDRVWPNATIPYVIPEYTFTRRNIHFEKFPEKNVTIIVNYSYKTVMHYGEDTFSKNGNVTLIPLSPGVRLNHPRSIICLPQEDIDRINTYYRCIGENVKQSPDCIYREDHREKKIMIVIRVVIILVIIVIILVRSRSFRKKYKNLFCKSRPNIEEIIL